MKDLIKLAKKLEQSNFKKESAEISDIINKISQDLSYNVEVESVIDNFKNSVSSFLQREEARIRQIASDKPENYAGSTESWVHEQLKMNPAKFTYPRM